MRYLRFARINKLWLGKNSNVTVTGKKYTDLSNSDPYYHRDAELKQSYEFGYHNPYAPGQNVDKTLPRVPQATNGYSASRSHPDFTRSSSAYYDEQAIQPLGQGNGQFADPYADPRDQRSHHSMSTTTTLVGADMQKQNSSSTQASQAYQPPLRAAPIFKPPPIPSGYAQAQLLPSRTIRLTIIVPHPFKWAPGQSCLLYLPDLSKLQSHPFTMINNSDSEMVILVKARKGITRKLYDLVRARSQQEVGGTDPSSNRLSLASARSGGAVGLEVPPIHVRAWVDGPFGSAARVHWNEFSTVTIICGGSGVSFGAAVCDYVCRLMASQASHGNRKVKTRRVRFCWVARQYGELVHRLLRGSYSFQNS